MYTCGFCNRTIVNCGPQTHPKCGQCKKMFHYSRCSLPPVTWKQKVRDGEAYLCDACLNPGNNDENINETDSSNNDSSSTSTPEENRSSEHVKAVLEKLQEINSSISTDNSIDNLKAVSFNLLLTTTKLAESVGYISQKYDILLKKQESQDNEIAFLRQELKTTQTKFYELEQYTYRDNVEIKAIPVTPGEQCNDLVKSIGRAVGVEISDSDISIAHRTPTRKAGEHPNLVVRLNNRERKFELINACRKKKPTLNNIGFHNNRSSFYVSDHLSPYYKRIMSLTAAKRKEKQWRYLWTSNCAIFVKKNDEERAIRIVTEEDLIKIV